MAKLSKAEAKAHNAACAILEKSGPLTFDEKWDVYENWREDAQHMNSLAGAFFTPTALARDFCLEVPRHGRILDLCAGIGVLSFMASHQYGREDVEIVCVEANPDYIAVGKRLLPDAEWIQADVFDLPDLGHFGAAISNPPFGATSRSGKGPSYTGSKFEYHVIDIAAGIADYGVFIVPQNSAPFRFSGAPYFQQREDKHYKQFKRQTGIRLDANCGIDTEYYRDQWHGTSPAVEIVCCDFEEFRQEQATPPPTAPQGEQLSLF